MKTAEQLLNKEVIVNVRNETFPLISFIMPVYNDGESVRQAIESILDNDWPNIEVIAVNDGSTDNSKEVLDSIKDKRVSVIHFPKNKGACHARNEGAKKAKGKYFAWLPADARIYPGMVRVWVETLEKYPEYDFLYGGYKFINHDGSDNSVYWSDQFEPYLLECANYIDGSFPIKAETYWRVAKLMNQKDGLWDPKIKSLQDWDFWLSVVKEGKGKGLYYKDIFFETTMPHPGGLSFDSHANWLARTRAIKTKHGIPDRKICVTSPGAPFFGKYIAHILNADFQYSPSFKDHEYDMIYLLGFYPSISDESQMVFVNPKFMSQYAEYVRTKTPMPLAPAIKVVHLIGTDIYQMMTMLNSLDLKIFQAVLNGQIDHCFVEFNETYKECKELGIKTDILPIPPRKYFETTPLPEQFTVAVYAPAINQQLYNYDLMVKIAKSLPEFKFKFFGNAKDVRIDGNIEYCGYVTDMAEFINSCSCLMRITSHDGLPQSVLEFLSAGRRVIFNHEFPNVNQADKQIDHDRLVSALKEESQKPIDLKSAKWIRKEFDKEKFKEKIYSLLKYDPKKFWEQKAETWISLRKNYYGTKDWDEIKLHIDQIKPKSVIDIGCGDGQWSDKFDMEYLGVDISAPLIKYAKKNHKKEFIVSSLEDLKVTKKYDLAFCYTLFEHISEENMPKAVEALKKTAKKAILVEPLDIKTKYYCHNHNFKEYFKIEFQKTLGKRTLMIINLE